MKKLLSVILIIILSLSFFACKETGTITLTEIPSFEIHTANQLIYYDDYHNVSTLADGKSEQSKPNSLCLNWTSDVSGEFTLAISENSDMSNSKTYTVSDTKYTLKNLKIATTYYWQVSSGKIKSKISSFTTSSYGCRNIDIDGVTNVRDVGGHMTSSGKRMAQGLLYRGGRLNVSDPDNNGYATISKYVRQITDEGANTFINELGVKTEIDFRYEDRNGFPTGMTPSSPAGESVNYIPLRLHGSKAFTEAQSQANIVALMNYLAVKDNYPIYYHCNIGTDRTGLITYLLQGLCGVSEEDLKADYYFSNFGNIGDFKDPNISPDTIKAGYMLTLNNTAVYQGETLQDRIKSYFLSIGVSEQTLNSVKSILMGE